LHGINEKLADTERRLNFELEKAFKQQNIIIDDQQKIQDLERVIREKVAEEKILRMNLGSLESSLNNQSFRPLTSSSQSMNPPTEKTQTPPFTPTLSEDNPLSKEEIRMYNLIHQGPTRSKSMAGSPGFVGGVGSKNAEFSGSGSPGRSNSRLTDWKLRQMQKEKEDQEKLEREAQKKKENFQFQMNSTDDEPATAVILHLPLIDPLTDTEKEVQRLSRHVVPFNKPGQKLV